MQIVVKLKDVIVDPAKPAVVIERSSSPASPESCHVDETQQGGAA